MNASFFLTLIAFFLCADAAELPSFKQATSFPKSNGSPVPASSKKNDKVVSSPAPKPNKYYPFPSIEFAYKRSGKVSVTHYGVSIDECIQICRNNSDRCLAINYQIYNWNCEELETLGAFSADKSFVTTLVNYKENDDPCSENYFMKDLNRSGFYYTKFSTERAPTPRDCCLRCRESPGSRCKIWTFFADKRCYLRGHGLPLAASQGSTTGFGVLERTPNAAG